MRPSSCRQCGRPILWTHREDGRFNPPLDAESAQSGFCILAESEDVHFTYMYKRHVCILAESEAHAKFVEDRDRRREERDNMSVGVFVPAWQRGPGLNDYREVPDTTQREAFTTETPAEEQVRIEAERQRGVERDARWAETRADKERAREEHREKRWALALPRQCPSCKASHGVKCWNLTSRAYGKKIHTITPHADRILDDVS